MPAQRLKPTSAERLACAHSTRGHAGGSRDRTNAPDHRPCGHAPPPGPPRPSPLATGLSAAAVLRAQGRTFSSRLGLLLRAGPIRPMLPFIRTTASLPSLAAHPRFRNLAPCAPRVRAKPLRARPLRQVLGGLRVSRLPRRGLGPWAFRLGPCVLGRASWVLGLGPWAKQKAAGFHRRPNHVRVDWFGACTPLRTARTRQHPQGRKPIAWPSCSASGSPPWGASFGSLTRD
jgi:hypothetical protein